MQVLPGTPFPQTHSGHTATDAPAYRARNVQAASTQHAPGVRAHAHTGHEDARQVTQLARVEKPRPDLPRGSLIDIKV